MNFINNAVGSIDLACFRGGPAVRRPPLVNVRCLAILFYLAVLGHCDEINIDRQNLSVVVSVEGNSHDIIVIVDIVLQLFHGIDDAESRDIDYGHVVVVNDAKLIRSVAGIDIAIGNVVYCPVLQIAAVVVSRVGIRTRRFKGVEAICRRTIGNHFKMLASLLAN